jgi:Osmosensitive K+ channel histidine kinase
MKLRVKLIAAVIFFSLISAFLFQTYWLKSFYNEQFEKLEVNIMDALRNADYREIYQRIDMLRSDTLARIYNPGEMYILLPNRKEKEPNTTGFPNEMPTNADDLSRYFQRELHQTVGDIKKIDFSVYENLLQIELIQRGIVLESFTEMVDMKTGRVMSRIPNNIPDPDTSQYVSFVFPVDREGNYAYRLNVKQPRKLIIKQMSGILGTSLFMMICLFISYIYLLRIIYKQKSVDQIKSDFVNNMTHELKTPISVAYAANDALLNYGMSDDPEKQKEYLTLSKEQLQHLNSLVEQILTMSVEERKNLKLNPEKINLLELFNLLKKQYLFNASKTVVIDIVCNPPNLSVRADRIHFQNMLGNLIENSIKYSKEKVKIEISATQKNKTIWIVVKDNGIGIPASSLSKIFDRFYRVSTGNIHNVKGYGLGLYYVKTIIEKHGWSVRTESKEGKGTIFYIRIDD